VGLNSILLKNHNHYINPSAKEYYAFEYLYNDIAFYFENSFPGLTNAIKNYNSVQQEERYDTQSVTQG
jgi:hypothetical protein